MFVGFDSQIALVLMVQKALALEMKICLLTLEDDAGKLPGVTDGHLGLSDGGPWRKAAAKYI